MTGGMERPRRLPTAVWRVLAVVLLVSLALAVYADAGDLFATLRRYEWWLLPAAMGLTLLNQGLRFLKWEFLLRRVGIDVPLVDSAGVFASALVMILSPGKIGELWKSWMLRDEHGVPVRRSSPVVAVERLTDLVGVVVLALFGVRAFGRSVPVVVGLLGCLVVGVAVLGHESTCHRLLDAFERVPRVNRHVGAARRLYENSTRLLRADVLVAASALSAASWLFECLALWVILGGFGANVGLPAAAFVFAFSSILGAVSFLPGGVGVTEGSMTLLLVELGTTRDVAVGATLLTRAATLWFSAGIALVALPGYYTWRRRGTDGGET